MDIRFCYHPVSTWGLVLTVLSIPWTAFASLIHPGSFDVTINFGTGLSGRQEAVFTQAETFWEDVITGYQPGISVTGPTIRASAPIIDGPGGILGQAGPDEFVSEGGFVLATSGIMQFDSADLANLENIGILLDVIVHEMGHVLGFGTLWTDNGVYVNGSGEYTGANGLAAFQKEFVGQSGATFVPVELGGGPGTANGHWDENRTLVTTGGENLANELMTGFLNTPTFVSETTKQSFVDIGFTVAAVPEPSMALPSFIALLMLIRRRRP